MFRLLGMLWWKIFPMRKMYDKFDGLKTFNGNLFLQIIYEYNNIINSFF